MKNTNTPMIDAVIALRRLEPSQREEALALANLDAPPVAAMPKPHGRKRKALGSMAVGVSPLPT